MEITKERMEEAIIYLAETDAEWARAKAYANGLAEQKKPVLVASGMRAGPSAAAKEQAGYASAEYRHHLERLESAEYEYLTLDAKRKTAEITIDCWRSLNAARNKMQVI